MQVAQVKLKKVKKKKKDKIVYKLKQTGDLVGAGSKDGGM